MEHTHLLQVSELVHEDVYKRQDDALGDVGVGGIDLHVLQADFQDLEYQNAKQDAGDGAHAAVGGYAANGTGGNGFQLISEACSSCLLYTSRCV